MPVTVKEVMKLRKEAKERQKEEKKSNKSTVDRYSDRLDKAANSAITGSKVSFDDISR